MMHILKCKSCSSYGLDKKCTCGETRVNPKPPRYSTQDKYGKYRREFKADKNNTTDKNDGLDDDDSQED